MLKDKIDENKFEKKNKRKEKKRKSKTLWITKFNQKKKKNTPLNL
jgi:ribosomal protein L20